MALLYTRKANLTASPTNRDCLSVAVSMNKSRLPLRFAGLSGPAGEVCDPAAAAELLFDATTALAYGD